MKYKKCCLGKSEEQKFAEAYMQVFESAKKAGHFKECFHPNKAECDERIIKAHAIQNNRILKALAVDGEVVLVNNMSPLGFQHEAVVGRKAATIFTGFCAYHDKLLFQEIEDREFLQTPKQVFLYTYRTFAWHHHKKREQVNRSKFIEKEMAVKGYLQRNSDEAILLARGFELGLSNNELKKAYFNETLLNERYEDVQSVLWEIPFVIDFAVSMMHELEFDILGNRILDMEKDKYTPSIYLNIFPGEKKSFCLWSWLKNEGSCFASFAEQFMELSERERINYLNNQLPRWTDAIIISPRIWERWGEDIQQAFISHANFDVLYRVMEEEENLHAYEYMETPWDLFAPIDKERGV